MIYEAGDVEVVVIGAGHAGCEAALATSRIGCKTLLVTMSVEYIALMPCNPSIGGPAKAQLVREIDALGGEMAINIDKSSIQMRLINTGKGPAVQALRAQADKHVYGREMIKTILAQPNLQLLMAEVEEIETENGRVKAIVTRTGARYGCKAVVLTSGTYLKGRIIAGEVIYDGGPGN
jgi:tRNA uridine 5-carboxymethylaminomethyl modification enzyme